MRSFREFVNEAVDQFGRPIQKSYGSIFGPSSISQAYQRHLEKGREKFQPQFQVINKISGIAEEAKAAITERKSGIQNEKFPNATMAGSQIIGISKKDIGTRGLKGRTTTLNIRESTWLRNMEIIIDPGQMGVGTVDIDMTKIGEVQQKLEKQAGYTRWKHHAGELAALADKILGQAGQATIPKVY